MTAIWRSIRRLVGGVKRKTIFDDLDEFDEKHVRWPSQLRLPRVRRVTMFLFMADVVIFGVLIYLFEPLITLLIRNNELFGARFSLPTSPNTTLIASYGKDRIEIPKILHQTSATADIPDSWVFPQQSCKKAYEDFEYKHWTDDLARAFISIEYPWFLEMWDGYSFPIQRADSIRYFVLHHFGGIYLDMDTLCKEQFPVDSIDTGGGHYALFKSTTPTGITNDFMVATAGHPAYTDAIAKLPVFYRLTQTWAKMEPYIAIMMSSGPLFLTLAVKDYLLNLPSLPTRTVEVVTPPGLSDFITDLESSSWHRSDTHLLMWLGERPWSWYTLGVLGLTIGVFLLNRVLLLLCKVPRKVVSLAYSMKIIR